MEVELIMGFLRFDEHYCQSKKGPQPLPSRALKHKPQQITYHKEEYPKER
jgi:hypothetical protein